MESTLKRRLLALSGLELRARWLEGSLPSWPIAQAAQALNALAQECEATSGAAVEAMLPVSLCLIRMSTERSKEGAPRVDALRREAAGCGHLSLERLLRKSDTEIERPVIRVPDYGAARELTLGERRSLARRPDRRHFPRLLADPSPMVASILLGNPHLTLDDVLRMTARRPASPEVLQQIACSPRWFARRRVRRSILLNPSSPDPVAMPLLPLCDRTELGEVVDDPALPLLRRSAARELFDLRPPLAPPPQGTLQ